MEAVAVKELTALLQQGSITLQMYAEGLAAIKTQKHHEACSYCYVVIRYDGQTEPSIECLTSTSCFASSWLTAPMNSRQGSTWSRFSHFNGLRL